MLDASPEKLLVVGFIAFVVLGPSRLPEVARALGRFVAHLRRVSSGFQSEVRGALAEPTEAIQSALGDWRPPTNIRKAVRDTVTSALVPPAAAGATGVSDGATGTNGGGVVSANGAGGTNIADASDGRGATVDADQGAWGDPSPLPDDPALN